MCVCVYVCVVCVCMCVYVCVCVCVGGYGSPDDHSYPSAFVSGTMIHGTIKRRMCTCSIYVSRDVHMSPVTHFVMQPTQYVSRKLYFN